MNLPMDNDRLQQYRISQRGNFLKLKSLLDRFMISKKLFEAIREKNGAFANWAIWENAGMRPKSNMGPDRIFDLDLNPNILSSLNVETIMVALNFSRTLDDVKPLANFHDESRFANDFKIRYAFRDTPYYGAYMTDVLKDVHIPDVQGVRRYLRERPEDVMNHIQYFESELESIQSKKPLILAFGADAYGILIVYLDPNRYSKLIQITHYSHHINKDLYRKKVLQQIHGGI